MAKGSRSSVRKTNNQALKARVFGPVETARTERLSQKLLELAQQPRPQKNEMDVEKDEPENTDAQEKAPADQAEGSSKCFSWSIPPSLLASSKNDTQNTAEDEVFYHLLGLSGDIAGSTAQGNLTMEVDDAKPSMSSLKKKTGRVQKKRRGKATSTVTFKNFRTGARKPAPGKKGDKR
ncbi:gpi ethanolamine phosphate transferase [Botryosphaeria dothidea]|uniref:Gpi ethanolamine phosphate transferase n=1 Tax=Botryosphaeria dothidea TaxID=55169 RepID=A0A8H4IKD5_9PEZI|nr:gpi ethanolamine phosphate transferase [Botryosphaeria dothidea]